MALGTPRLHLRVTTSTNDRARALAQGGAPHGAVVTAAHQTAGRGRQGRHWSAPPDSAVLMSVVLRDAPRLLPLAAAVAVARTCGPDARIKWPNDVLLPGGKVAGILAEGRPTEGWMVLGIGVNVAVAPTDLPPEVQTRAATLGLSRQDIEPFLARLLEALEVVLATEPSVILDAWRTRDALAGREVSWSRGRGVAEGIDDWGRLIIALADGRRHALSAGEVHLTVT